MRFFRDVRIYLCTEPTDMRKQINGLSIVVREGLQRNPGSGEMFVFRNRRGDMLRILFFDSQGFCLLTKRLEKGTFVVDLSEAAERTSVELTKGQLGVLLQGLKLRWHRN